MTIKDFEIRMALRGRQTDCLVASQTIERDIGLMKDMLIQLKGNGFCPDTLRFYMKRISQSEELCRYFTRKFGELSELLDGKPPAENMKGKKMTLYYDRQMKRTDGDASLIVEITASGGLESAKAFCEVFEDYVDCTDRIAKDDLKMKRIWADVDYATEAEKEQNYDLAK